MNPHELRTVIEQPAALPDVQLLFEGNLVGDLLFEAQGQPGALPLLEFTLDQLFHQRDGHRLTHQAYQQLGGVKGALAKHAESTYASLPFEEHRRLARALFLRLIDPGNTEQDTTRRRASLAELLLPDAQQAKIMCEVADTFIAARLLMTNEMAGTTTIEVSHEALIREWTRLAEWLREAREDIHLQQTISEDVTEWEQRGKPNDRLYRGSQLKEADTWAKRNVPTRSEVTFLRASTRQRIRSLASTIAAVCLLISSMGIAGWFYSRQSSTIVTNLQDDGPGSLRQAINTAPARSVITFDPRVQGAIELTSGHLSIGKNLTLRGPGADKLAISSGARSFVIHVNAGVSVSISDLAFKNSIIKLESTDFKFNSFIHNEGTLTLTNSVISGNKAFADNSDFVCAGGIFNYGTLTLENSTVSGNSVSGGSSNSVCAGGIFNYSEKMLTLKNSTVSGNRASGERANFICSGGIFNVGTLVLTNSTVSDNHASGGNSSSTCSGGIYNQKGTLNLTNSTISGNTTAYNGGGILSEGGKTHITFCTIYGNTAQEGGGSYISIANTNSSSVTIRNSIIAGNTALTHPDIAGPLASDGYNLIQVLSGATFAPPLNQHLTDLSGDQFISLGIEPRLRDNGGLAQSHPWTHRLLPDSPAIDQIPPEVCHANNVSTDQRGVKRPQGSSCDIGAYEYIRGA
jgi:hypothetical protein